MEFRMDFSIQITYQVSKNVNFDMKASGILKKMNTYL